MAQREAVEAKVAEARPQDVGRGVCRLDPVLMQEMGVTPGDAVLLEGKRRAAALLLNGFPEDRGRGIIRMDGILRHNAATNLDERVRVRRTEVRSAERITVAPTEPLRIQGGEQYLARVLEGRVVTRGDLIPLGLMGRRLDFVVTGIRPSAEVVIMTAATEVEMSDRPATPEEVEVVTGVSYDDIGGMGDAVKRVREMIELPLRHPEIFDRIGVEAPKGVLLHGPPGTGKTLLAKAVANESGASFYTIGGPEIMSKFYGESEERLRDTFKQAEENAPSIIFIDEIDSIAPKREETQGEVERRVVAQLLTLMDGMKGRGQVVVIGATNRPNAMDPALRRPGRFDREITIGVPDAEGRHEILQIHARNMPLARDVDLRELSRVTHGYVGADLAALAREAGMRAVRRILPEIDLEARQVPAEVLEKLVVRRDDFMTAHREITPTALREVFVEAPNVRWTDVGGLEPVKRELRETVEWPLKYGRLYDRLNARPAKGILLFGSPGTGKTLLAKAVATESEANFISVRGPEFLSKWVGESEKAVREAFRKAREAAPCVIFFDEVDAIVPARGSGVGDSHVTDRVLSQMLTELDGMTPLSGVTVIAATNRADIIDPALLRPGRFDRLIEVPHPDEAARLEILSIHTRGVPLGDDVRLEELARETEGLSGAEVADVPRQATMLAVREFIESGRDPTRPEEVGAQTVDARHFREAFQRVRSKRTQETRNFIRAGSDMTPYV